MSEAITPPRTLAHELVEALVTLFVGAILQVGRVVLLIGRKVSRSSSRRTLRAEATRMGQRMAEAGIGNALILQKLGALPVDGPARREVLEELGTSGLETGVPLLGMEQDYQAGRKAFEAARAAERAHDETAAKIWPAHPLVWLALIANYVLLTVAAILLFAYLYPTSVPDRLATFVGKGPVPPELPPPAPKMEVQIGSLNVVVTRAAVSRSEIWLDKVVVLDDQLLLRVRISITNTGLTPVRYHTWRRRLEAQADAAGRIVDDRGKSPMWVVHDHHAVLLGHIHSVVIHPGETVHDFLVFAPPEPRFNSLELFLPGGNVGRGGETFRITIPGWVVDVPDTFK